MKLTHRLPFSIFWLTLTFLVITRVSFSETLDPGIAEAVSQPSQVGSMESTEAVSRIVLDISTQQVVGHPFAGFAQMLLLDDSSKLVTDYDFAGDPFDLTASTGSLTPNLVNDSNLFSGGIVNLMPLGVVYEGPSGTVSLTASNASTTSSGALVSFSGYEILSWADRLGQPLSTVYSGHPISVRVPVSNGGALTATAEPTLKAYFASGGGSVKVFLTPHRNGIVDTIPISLPTTGLSTGQDTLVLVLESIYQPAATPLTVSDTVRTPVTVKPQADFALVNQSLKPDSVFPGVPFDFSFDVSVGGFDGPIDSTSLAVHLVTETDSIISTITETSPPYTSFVDSTITYSGVSAVVDSALGLAPGWYHLRFDYRLASGNNVFTLGTAPLDSLLILPVPQLAYVEGSFGPVEVSSGQESTFEFNISLEGLTPMRVDPEASEFVINGVGFETKTNLVIEGDSLAPLDNYLTTGQVFIPANHLGETLSVAATIVYYREGSGNKLTFTTDFGGEAVMVEELPTVQIQQVSVQAPNSPNVNINQDFRITFRIANLSTTDQPPFDIQMVTDGSSIFEPYLTIPGVPGGSEIDSFVVVKAASLPNPSEIFRIDISTLGVNQLPPIDNIAQAMIQERAQLTTSVILRGGTEGYVTVNDDFDLIITVVNSGEAETTDGEFTLTTNGLDLGVTDPLVFTAEVGQPSGIEFRAPSFDTSLTIDFELTKVPLDVNTGLPAQIDETQFQVELAVLSEELELVVSAEPVRPNVVLPDETRELLLFTLDNKGASSVSAIQLKSMSFSITDASGRPLNARSVMEVGSTGLFDGPHEVTRAVAGSDRLDLLFEDFVINGSGPVVLSLHTKVKAAAGETFGINLNVQDIKAVFASGPLKGQEVVVLSSGYGNEITSELYTSVSADLKGSFVIRDNPFNPEAGEAEFQYYHAESGQVTFRVLTLTGELVYQKTYAEAGSGSRTIDWDGRNDKGEMVLNGVYLAVLTDERSGEQAVLKVAVLK